MRGAGIEEQDLARNGYQASFTTDEDTPPDDVLQELIALVEDCGGTAVTDALTESIAESLAADGTLTAEQATCVAQGVLDALGADRMLELSGSGDFATRPLRCKRSSARRWPPRRASVTSR